MIPLGRCLRGIVFLDVQKSITFYLYECYNKMARVDQQGSLEIMNHFSSDLKADQDQC